jgi:hypothetical protein
MKRLLNILFILCLYLILCSKSCSDDTGQVLKQEEEVAAAKDSIRSEFEAGYLSEEARFASEMKAIQELKDLSDYIMIYSDASLDPIFRENAAKMIRNIFISENTRLSFGIVKKNKVKSLTLNEFLQKGFGDNISGAEVIFDSIKVVEPLQKSGDETYSGRLSAYQTVIFKFSADSIRSSSKTVIIDFISSKQTKIIGQDTLKVWNVRLGEMESDY